MLIVQGFLIVIPLVTVAACASEMKPHPKKIVVAFGVENLDKSFLSKICICSFNSGKYFLKWIKIRGN